MKLTILSNFFRTKPFKSSLKRRKSRLQLNLLQCACKELAKFHVNYSLCLITCTCIIPYQEPGIKMFRCFTRLAEMTSKVLMAEEDCAANYDSVVRYCTG